MENELRLCAVCGLTETGRLMDGGWGEKLPVCGECLKSGRWRELLPKPEKPKPEKPKPPAQGKVPVESEGFGDYLCPQCKVTHRAGSKIHKRHLKLLKG